MTNFRIEFFVILEKKFRGAPIYDSHLVTRCHELRKLPLERLSTEDLRIMIGQEIGLEYLIPLALEILSNNLFAEGDYYEGDLLNSVLSIPTSFWDSNAQYWHQLDVLIKNRCLEISERKIETVNFYKSKYA